MRLNELLTDKYPWEWDKEESTRDTRWAVIEVSETRRIDVMFDSHGNHKWEVEFSSTDPNDKSKFSYKPTGEGDQFRIFATIIAIMTEFAGIFDPETLIFNTNEPSRVRLYGAMLKKFASVHGYEFDAVSNPNIAGDQTHFTITL